MGKRKKHIYIEDLIEPYPLKNRPSLTHSHPEVAVYWLMKRNCHFGPEDFSYGSGVKVWWRCPRYKEHEYQERIHTRVKAEQNKSKVHGCPYCRGFLPCPQNWLANYPRLAKEWMTDKNGRSPKEVVAGSAVLGWWCCLDCGHEWKAHPANRTKNESGCVKCNRGETTDLRNYPKILRQFDRKKNRGINPYALSLKTVAWWKCPVAKDHRWQSTFHRRKGERCPFCLGYRPSSTNNLTLLPAIAKQLHPTRNGKLKAKDLPLGSNRRVWWKCRQGPDHEWETSVYVRTHKEKSACPFCINQWVSITNCLATVAPDVATDWHPVKNKPLTPKTVLAVGNVMAHWRCFDCGHEWRTRVRHRVKYGSDCPECRKVKRRFAKEHVTAKLSLKRQFPKIAKQWHPTRNGDLTPGDVSALSSKVVWWFCLNYEAHEWEWSVGTMTKNKGACPSCRKQQGLGKDSLAKRFPAIAKQWHKAKNGTLKPEHVRPSSSRLVWWICDKGPDHVWQATIANRTGRKSGCPCCSGRKASITNSLAALFPEIAAEWHRRKNDDITPDLVTYGSHFAAWWQCPKKHVYQKAVTKRTHRGEGCSTCPRRSRTRRLA